MAGYTIAIQKDSPVYKLYQKLKADGVKDADLDTGYPETDYVNKTRTIVHKGDRKIEAAEVLDYALEHYERYRLAIEKATDSEIPWVLFDAEIRGRIDQTIAKFRQIITRQGAQEGTDRFSELMAVALFAYVLSSQAVPAKVKQELAKEGLGEITDHLARNGGLAVSEFKGDCEREAAVIGALAEKCGGNTEKNKVLYAVMREAGLKVKYLTVLFGQAADPKLGRRIGLHDVAVSVTLGGEKRIFDASLNELDAEAVYRKKGFGWWFEQTGRESLADNLINLAVNYGDNLHRPDLAVIGLDRALKLDPGSTEGHYDLGIVYLFQGRSDGAIEEFTKAVKLDPDFIEARLKLGAAYHQKGRLDRAIGEFEAIAKVAPDLAEAHGSLGIAFKFRGAELEKAGKNKEALEAYRRSWEELKRAEALGARLTQEAIDFFQNKLGLPGAKD